MLVCLSVWVPVELIGISVHLRLHAHTKHECKNEFCGFIYKIISSLWTYAHMSYFSLFRVWLCDSCIFLLFPFFFFSQSAQWLYISFTPWVFVCVKWNCVWFEMLPKTKYISQQTHWHSAYTKIIFVCTAILIIARYMSFWLCSTNASSMAFSLWLIVARFKHKFFVSPIVFSNFLHADSPFAIENPRKLAERNFSEHSCG